MEKPVYKRVVIKISGEALAGEKKTGFDFDFVTKVCQTVKRCAEMGVEMPPGVVRGGSDGNFTASTGCPTLDGLGSTGGHVHQLGEYINLSHLPFRLAFTAEMTLRVLERSGV